MISDILHRMIEFGGVALFPELSERARWRIVGLLSASIAVNLIDRQVLSVVAPVIREHFALSNTHYSYVVFAFQLGMFLGQIPAGILMDRVGTRRGLVAIAGRRQRPPRHGARDGLSRDPARRAGAAAGIRERDGGGADDGARAIARETGIVRYR
jgi:Major Facilitator Superfamily